MGSQERRQEFLKLQNLFWTEAIEGFSPGFHIL